MARLIRQTLKILIVIHSVGVAGPLVFVLPAIILWTDRHFHRHISFYRM